MNETANVNLSFRDEKRAHSEAAESYGRDTVILVELALENDGDEYLDMVRLQARIAFRFARSSKEAGGDGEMKKKSEASICPGCQGAGGVRDDAAGTAPVIFNVCPQCDGQGTLEELGDKPPTSTERAMGVE